MMIPMETRPKHKAQLPPDFAPGKFTVLCGRGKVCSSAPGNKHLKSLVQTYLTPYSNAKNKIEKTAIVSAIVDSVRKEDSGVFVRQEKDGVWWEVEDSFAREKIGCIFRDILHTQYRSSTKAKFARKKALKKSRESKLLNGSSHSRSSHESTSSSMPPFTPSTNLHHVVMNNTGMNLQQQDGCGGLPASVSCFDKQNFSGCGMPMPPSFRPQPRMDVFRNFPSEKLIRPSYQNKSAGALLEDAFQILGMPTSSNANATGDLFGDDDLNEVLPDLPDDLSGIFEEGVW